MIDYDLSGLVKLPLDQIMERRMMKEDLAKEFIPKDITYDYALPQEWLDKFVDWIVAKKVLTFSESFVINLGMVKPERNDLRELRNLVYDLVLGTTFMLYSRGRGFPFGNPWSCSTEIDKLIYNWIWNERRFFTYFGETLG